MKPDKAILAIDRNNLDRECDLSPQNLFIWGEELAHAKRRKKDAEIGVEMAKMELKAILGETKTKIRSDPVRWGLAKVTEDSVEARALASGQYRTALQEYHQWQQALAQAEEEENVLFAFVMALNDKKIQISNLIELHKQQFWSRPYVAPDPEPDNVEMMSHAAGGRKSRRGKAESQQGEENVS